MSVTPPRECMRTTAAPARAHTSALRGSSRNAETSLMISAPASSTARATSLFTVSTESGTVGRRRLRSRTTGSTRRSSSGSSTGVGLCGRVLSPPMSSRSAPSSTSRSPCATAASTEKNLPPSLKLSGVTLMIPMMQGPSSGRVRERRDQGIKRCWWLAAGGSKLVAAGSGSSHQQPAPVSSRRHLRTAQKRGLRGLELRHGDGRRGRGRCTGGQLARRQFFAAHQDLNVIRRQRFALEQRTRDRVQQINVVHQRLTRALIARGEQPLHLRIHQLRRALGYLTPVSQLATQEHLLLVVANQHRTN